MLELWMGEKETYEIGFEQGKKKYFMSVDKTRFATILEFSDLRDMFDTLNQKYSASNAACLRQLQAVSTQKNVGIMEKYESTLNLNAEICRLAGDSGFDVSTAGLTSTLHKELVRSYVKGKLRIHNYRFLNERLGPNARPNLLTPQTAIDVLSAAESTTYYYLVAACVYGTLEYVKSLHQAFKNTEDPLPKMLAFATCHNRPEIAKYCIGAGAGVGSYGPYDLQKCIVTGNSYQTFKVLYHHGLDINKPIDHYESILLCAVEENNLDWVRFCLENHANPALEPDDLGQPILATAASCASIEISELLIAWGAIIKGSSALTIASHRGKVDLVKLLLKNGADVNEMGVASTDDDPVHLEGTALHLIKKGRKDILGILLDHGPDVNLKDPMGKTAMSRMYEKGDKALVSILMKHGGSLV